MRPFRFRPRGWAALLAAAGCAAGIALGNWQSGRADEKRAAAAGVQRTELKGSFHGFSVFLDNKTYRGRAGYQVVQALRASDGKNVLVNRGWIAAGPRRDQLPQVTTPPGEVALEGVRLDHLPRALEPSGT